MINIAVKTDMATPHPAAAASPAADLAVSVKSAGSSFYRAMALLGRDRREAMFALYAFCRLVDDIADDDGRARAARLEDLELWRARILALYAETKGAPSQLTDHPLCRDLARLIARYQPQQEDFIAIIDGMVMDADPIVAPDLDLLDLYCDRVASAVGRISIRIFGDSSGAAHEVAYHLGRALQLTNILRDLAEDAARGRLYLPSEILDANQIASRNPAEVLAHPHLPFACANLALLADEHYMIAFDSMERCRHMRAARLMGHAYQAILKRLTKAGWQRPLLRIEVPAWEKFWILVRYGFLP